MLWALEAARFSISVPHDNFCGRLKAVHLYHRFVVWSATCTYWVCCVLIVVRMISYTSYIGCLTDVALHSRLLVSFFSRCPDRLKIIDQWLLFCHWFAKIFQFHNVLRSTDAQPFRWPQLFACDPHLWNHLPVDLRQVDFSHEHFKRQLKSQLFRNHGALLFLLYLRLQCFYLLTTNLLNPNLTLGPVWCPGSPVR